MSGYHSIGFDIHKRSIQYCVKGADGRIVEEGRLRASREELAEWAGRRGVPWRGAMEATMFSGWVWDVLRPYGERLQVAHPAMLKAITAGKHASDRLDARKIADLVRMGWIPEVWMALPELRPLRSMLRWRQLLVRQRVQTKNRMASLLMEPGVDYAKQKLPGERYWGELMERLGREGVGEPVRALLEAGRGEVEMLGAMERGLRKRLAADPQLAERVQRLMTVPGVGQITALTWAVEVGDVRRFGSIGRLLSYCGLVAALQESAGKQHRQPLSKKRNQPLPHVLVEAAHLAARRDAGLGALYERVKAERHAGAAAVAVARKLAAYLLAVDRSGRPFQPRKPPQAPDPPAGKRAGRRADPAAPGPRHRIRRKPTPRQSSPQRDRRLRPRPAVRPLRLFRGWQSEPDSSFLAGLAPVQLMDV